MSPKFVPLTAIVFAAILGCGGDDAPRTAARSASPKAAAAKPASDTDVCALLTAAEIEAATGAKVMESKAEGHGAVGTCSYQAANELIPVVSLVLAPGMPEVATSAEMAAWRSKQGTSFGDLKVIIMPVEGLGVPAISNEVEGMGLITVEVAAKGLLLDVTTSKLESSKALVPKALARLP